LRVVALRFHVEPCLSSGAEGLEPQASSTGRAEGASSERQVAVDEVSRDRGTAWSLLRPFAVAAMRSHR